MECYMTRVTQSVVTLLCLALAIVAASCSGSTKNEPGGLAQAGTNASTAGTPSAGVPGSTPPPTTNISGAPAGAGSSGTTGGRAGTTASTAGTGVSGASGQSVATAGTGAAGAGAAGMVAAAGTSGAVAMPVAGTGIPSTPGDCSSLPPATDYAAKGPFADAKMFSGVGPSSNYTLFRPDASLGKDGFKHPIATWGNGITTTPSQYTSLLTTIASHGFVVIASNDTTAERPALSAGLDWLIEQNKAGEMQGKLDTMRELAIGYSWGGGAAIDTSNRPNIVATVSFHGMPPRETSAFQDMHSPLLLFTSTGDTFVSASGYVTPNYEKSTVQTFYATLMDSSFSHISIIPDAGPERGPAIAWLRFWACKDENARKFFYGDDCTLCTSPFTMPQRKSWN
jgi:hypothetical protein